MTDASFGRAFVALAVLLCLALIGTPVVAQEEEEQTEEVIDAGQSEIITVTAQKREQDPQDVPIALSVLGTEEIATLTAGGADVRFLSARVPSLLIESSFGRAFPRFYIRGLGNTDFDLNASQPVSLVYDGVVMENAITKGMPVFDMDRIEVLRGPQGTLFGRNTPAGVVSFVSNRPTQELEGKVKASFGSFNTIEAEGVVSGALSETISARLSVLYQSRSDWVDNGFTNINDALGGYDNGAWRLQFMFEPNDEFTGLLNLHGWEVDGTARIFRANIMDTGKSGVGSNFDRDKVLQDGLNSQDISSQGGLLQFDYDLGSATLTSITGFESLDMLSRGDIDGGFGGPFAPGPSGPGEITVLSESADGMPDLNQFTQEFRIASNADSGSDLGWLAGFFYFDEDVDFLTNSYDSATQGNPQDGQATQTQNSSAYALFGSLFYQLNDQWHLQGGLRYSDEEKDLSAERLDPTFQTPTIRPIVESVSASNTSWDLSATYSMNEDVNWYARVATGFRAPSIQGRILFCPDFEGGTNPATNCVSVADSEEILSAEIGVKSRLDDQVQLNVTAYTYEVDGQQLVAVGGEFNTATLLNADTTNGYGLEADVNWAPNEKWLATVGLSYNSTEIDDPDLAVGICATCTVTDPVVDGLAMIDGNSLPHAPEWIFNGIVDYRSALADGLIIASFDWAYHDEKQFFLYESREFVADAFELGLRVGYAFGEAKYEVALFGRNILDEEIVRNGIDFSNLVGMVNEPRTFGVEFGVNF